jgi:hypothetical protein
MKARITLLTLIVVLLGMMAYAADDPNMGTWKLNEGKSKIEAGTAKNTTVVYAADGDNVKVTTDGVDGSGKTTHSEWSGKFDGKAYPVTGDPNVDTRTYKKVNDRTMEITNKKGDKVTTTGKIVVAKDGKSRTVNTHGTTSDGKKVDNTYMYDKQ